jgi:excisionase family DNA binding protein
MSEGGTVREMTEESLWTVREVADYFRVPVSTVRRWNYDRSGPAFMKIGKHVRYVPAEVRAWAKRRRVA